MALPEAKPGCVPPQHLPSCLKCISVYHGPFLLKAEAVIWMFPTFEEEGLGFFFSLSPHTDYAERGLAACSSKESAASFAMTAVTTVPLAPS